MNLSYHAAEGMLRDGDAVKFRCDRQGRPLFKDNENGSWNRGTIVRVFGFNKKNPLYLMTFRLTGGSSETYALNAKNWPTGFAKMGVCEVVM